MAESGIDAASIETVIRAFRSELTKIQHDFTAWLATKTVSGFLAQIGLHNGAQTPFVVQQTQQGDQEVAEIFTTDQPAQAAQARSGFALTGVRPHIIRGNPVLKWYDPAGQPVYATFVVHPGYPPRVQQGDANSAADLNQQQVKFSLVQQLDLGIPDNGE